MANLEIDFNTYSPVYCSSIANQIMRALLEEYPNKYNSVYISDLNLIIAELQHKRDYLAEGNILTSENSKTLGN